METTRQRRLARRIALIAVALLTLAPGTAVAGERAGVITHAVAQDPASVAAAWTPERMRDAEPLTAPDAGTAPPAATAAAAAPDQETDPARDTTYPQRVHGVLFFRTEGQDASCSGTVVNARTRNLILTAGHCVAFPAAGGPNFSTDVVFVPGYRDGNAPFGAFPATLFRTPVLWSFEGDISRDIASVNLAPNAAGALVQDLVGARGVTFNLPDKKWKRGTIQIFGYPAQPSAFYNGERLIYCGSRFKGFERFTDAIVAGPCNQQQGSSGGAFMVQGNKVGSVVSHASCLSPVGCNRISGTYFGSAAFNVWAKGAGGLPKKVKKRIRKCKRIRKPGKSISCRNKAQTFQPVVVP